MSNFGYIRVSTKDQNEARQVIALRAAGVPETHIYTDKQSGKNFDRPKYKSLVRRLKVGDTLFVKSIDRLGRNYDEILDQWRRLTKDKGADIVVLDMPLLDTRRGKDLIGTLISDIVLQLLSYVAQTEREFIRQRQAEGISAAKARGVKFGRPPMERPPHYAAVRRQYENLEISARKAGTALGVSHKTFIRWYWQDENRRTDT